MENNGFKRVLLKISGEALMGDAGFGISPSVISYVAQEVQAVCKNNVQIGMVIGAGNIFRGVSGASQGMDRATADNMGMLGTVMNSLAMQDALEQIGIPTRVMSAIPMASVCEAYIRRRAIRHMEKGRVVIFAAGTGNPYFTTDTAAVLRALEIEADVIFKATRVDGIYDRDPEKHADAVHYPVISYEQVLQGGIKVMDAAAISLAQNDQLPIVVFNLKKQGNVLKAVQGQAVGSRVQSR